MAAEALFDAAFARRLEGLRLAARQALGGRYAGDRRTPKRGSSVEFADFRDYVSGDDLRRVDWKAYGRLERLFVKLFLEDQDAAVSLLIDTSGSMEWGEPRKAYMARRLAGALAFLGLAGGDRVRVAGLGAAGGGRGLAASPWFRGRAALQRAWDFIAGLPGGGEVDLNASLGAYAQSCSGPGIAVIVSDLLCPGGFDRGLGALQAARQEVTVVQVLSPDELEPGLSGELRLIDVETGRPHEVTVTPGVVDLYLQALGALQESARRFCARRGMTFLAASSATPAEDVVVGWLPRLGLVAR